LCREILFAGNVLKRCQLKEINRTETINKIEVPIIYIERRLVIGSTSRLLAVVNQGIFPFRWTRLGYKYMGVYSVTLRYPRPAR
jgi:hypothetical protein